jgi:glutamate-5-semialdehyde dehydrogenase
MPETQTNLIPLLAATRAQAPSLQRLPGEARSQLLLELAQVLEANHPRILVENQKDLDRMADDDPKKDRLLLDTKRLEGLTDSLRQIANLPDPCGAVLYEQRLDNGLLLQKVSVPLGVVGVIYESRPNVTIDVAALCLRSGNACVLRGGSDALYSNRVLVELIHEVLRKNSLSEACVQLLPTDRDLVPQLLTADRYVDILIPRGSQGLIDFVRQEATVPTIETGAGVCHTFVSQHADLGKAAQIVVNAKTSRPSVCNALDTVLLAKGTESVFLPLMLEGFRPFQVEIFADPEAFDYLKANAQDYPWIRRASEEDFGREFLDYKCSLKLVEGLEEALQHIEQYSSRHSEAIVSQHAEECERFLNEVDAAAVYANASTRFTDGGVFGLGAEIGISTQKLHARGPFALEKLVTEKWIGRGKGQTR